MQTVDARNESEVARDALADQREDELETGKVRPVPIDVAIARLEARFPG